MSLCLTITSYHKITPGQCAEKILDTGVMSIGRGVENDWVLPDPERLVSARHCAIQYKDGRYYLTDNSTNGVELVHAGVRLRRGNSEPLQDGELIRIGEYEIQARIQSRAQPLDALFSGGENPGSFEALMGRQEAPKAQPLPDSVGLAGQPHLHGASSFDTLPDLFDFLTPPTVAPVTQPDHVPAEQHDFRPPTPMITLPPSMPSVPSPSNNVIPDDWDPLADLSASASKPSVVNIPEPMATIPPLPSAFEAQEAMPPAIPPSLSSDSAQTTDPVAPVQAQAGLLQAFLRGAGIDQLRLDTVQAEAQMEAIGSSYRLMVEGLIDVLRARSSLKGEFRIQQTMIRPVENNPLKFAPNADEALLLLLRHGNPAFMAPDRAVSDSFDDLRAHQMAVMAGVDAAIKHLLKRFEPAELEARMSRPGGLGGLFGASRQAQYWQQFTELYSKISQEAEDDFQDLFGREFSRAYEEQSARLRRT
jgi:type VI secretion system protein